MKDLIRFNLTSSVNSNNGAFVKLTIVDVDGAGLLVRFVVILSLLSLSPTVEVLRLRLGLSMLASEDIGLV